MTRYLASAAEPASREITARELAARWKGLPHLTREEGAGLADAVTQGRQALGPARSAWE